MGIKYSINEKFFENWSKKMAYVLGFIYADGTIYSSSRGKYVVVTSTDKDIIFKIKKWLNSQHKISIVKPNQPSHKMRFVLRMGNKDIYESLVGLGLYPNKSLTIGFPEVPSKFLKDFVRGYFDGDGCVYLYRSKGKSRELIVRKLSVVFTSGSKNFLKELLGALRKVIGLKQKKIYLSHRSFQLRFATADSIALFKFLYKNTDRELFFARKFDIFLCYLKLRKERIDNEIGNILQCLDNGHVVK